MNKYWLALGISLLQFSTCQVYAVDQRTVIYFGNGIDNTYVEALQSQALLVDAYQDKLLEDYPGQIFEFKLAYNLTQGRLKDVIETIDQKLVELDELTANKTTAAQFYMRYHSNSLGFVPQVISLLILNELASSSLDSRDTAFETAAKFTDSYRTDLNQCHRVVIVAHSQGNLFANISMANLKDSYDSNIGMIGVASPAAPPGPPEGGNTNYWTAHDDHVINALRTQVSVLESNVDNEPKNTPDERDWTNHEFIKSYFKAGLETRRIIDINLDNLMRNLEFPTCDAQKIILLGAELHSIDSDGTNYTRLTSQNLDDPNPNKSFRFELSPPEMSPLNRHILFTANTTTPLRWSGLEGENFIVDAGGLVTESLTKLTLDNNIDDYLLKCGSALGNACQAYQTPLVGDRSPTWSPDGSRVAFVRHWFLDNPDDISILDENAFRISTIYTADRDGSNLSKVIDHMDSDIQSIEWSPDGKKIAYWTKDNKIFIVSKQDGTPLHIHTSPEFLNAHDMQFTTDGVSLLFSSFQLGVIKSRLNKVNINGSGFEVLRVFDKVFEPAWDYIEQTNQIIIVDYNYDLSNSYLDSSIFFMDTAGNYILDDQNQSEIKEIVFKGANWKNTLLVGMDRTLEISPDGKNILYYGLWKFNLETETSTMIFPLNSLPAGTGGNLSHFAFWN